MSDIKTAINTCNSINKVLFADPRFIHNRCLLTSTLLLGFLERANINARLWHGSTMWFSMEYKQQLEQNPNFVEDASPEELTKLRQAGVNMLAVQANQILQPTDLGGHVSVLAVLDGAPTLIDPTAYQFKRTKQEHNCTINAPESLFKTIEHKEFTKPQDSIIIHVESDYVARYEFSKVNNLDMLEAKEKTEPATTDLNFNRYPDIIEKIDLDLTSKT